MAGRRRWCWSGAVLNWLGNYDDVENAAVCLLFVQVLVGTIASLCALYSGIIVANLALALFALVAIESRSQALGRAYALFLATSILVDIAWFIIYTSEIEHITKDEGLGPMSNASAKFALLFQSVGLFVRLISSLFWIQMYRIGLNAEREAQLQGGLDGQAHIEADITDQILERHPSLSQEYLGGTIFNHAAFSSISQGSYQQYEPPDEQSSHVQEVKEESATWTAPVSVDEEAMALFEQAEQDSRRAHMNALMRGQ